MNTLQMGKNCHHVKGYTRCLAKTVKGGSTAAGVLKSAARVVKAVASRAKVIKSNKKPNRRKLSQAQLRKAVTGSAVRAKVVKGKATPANTGKKIVKTHKKKMMRKSEAKAMRELRKFLGKVRNDPGRVAKRKEARHLHRELARSEKSKAKKKHRKKFRDLAFKKPEEAHHVNVLVARRKSKKK